MDKASTLAAIREEAFQQKASSGVLRWGRGGIPKNRLLDDSDNNIGNAVTCNPQLLPTIAIETNPPRILALDALSPTGQMVTIALSNRYNSNPSPGFDGGSFGGPIIAIVEFGNGSIFTRVELDVPMGGTDTTGAEAGDGVTVISVPAGTLRVYARNDGNLIPSSVNGTPNVSLTGVVSGEPTIGLGARSNLIKASVDYFTHPSPTIKGATRTVYIWTTPGGAGPLSLFVPGANRMKIPPLSKAMRIHRTPNTAAMTVRFYCPENFSDITEEVAVPSGPSPLIDVPGNAFWFEVISASAAAGNFVSVVNAEFQIGL